MKNNYLSNMKNLILRFKIPAKITFFGLGVASTIWFLIRVIPKPTRATYPCMRAASPFMSGFFIYLAGLFLSITVFKKAIVHFKKSKVILGGILTVVAVMLGIGINHSISSGSETVIYASEPEQFEPNKPIGIAQGIYPGRVVWARDPDATSQIFTAPSYLLSNNDSAIINRMTQQTISTLTGKANLSEAWDLLFKSYNEKVGNGNTGYQSGQKIFIKINCNSAWGHPALSGTEFNLLGDRLGRALDVDYSFRKGTPSYGTFEGNAYTMLSIIDQLVNKAGVPQANISIGDPMRDIHKYTYDMLHAAFPNVHYLGHTNTYGRTLVESSKDTLVYFSDNGKVLRNYKNTPLKGIHLYSVVEEADYIINLAALKAHTGEGVTSLAKNYFGTLARIWAIEMHKGMVSPDFNMSTRAAGSYRVLVDLMGSKQLGGKTMLFFVDATFFCPDAYGSSLKFTKAPFNVDWPSSVLASQDMVAIESVNYDIIASQHTNTCQFQCVCMKGICEHLLHAADPASWPAGIIYSPNNDGVPLKSLGVYEHWNNATDMQYSRNLGTGNGIELIKIGPVDDLIAAPVKLTVNSLSSSIIKLLWKDNSNKEEGYIIESSKGDSLNYSQVGVVGKDSTNFLFIGAEINTKYYFQVKAYKGSVFSVASNEVSALTNPASILNNRKDFDSSVKVIPLANALKVIIKNDYKGTVMLTVYDLSGKRITSKNFDKTSQLKEEVIGMDGEKGLFIVSINCEEKSISKKVILK